MSIIKKKYDDGGTQLNKLKYAPMMSSGNPPLVQKRIPNETNTSPESSSTFSKRADDLSRIAKLFARKEGLGFLVNNTNLGVTVGQSYAVQGTIKDKVKALLDVGRGKALSNTVGTLASTLAQVPLSGTGTHFVKGKPFGKPLANFNLISKTTYAVGVPGAIQIKYGRDEYYRRMGESAYAVDKVNYVGAYPGAEADDYIKFNFEVLTPGETENVILHFRAFLDSFDDSYSSNWNSFNYVGRGEQFYTYGNFNRQINVTFKTAVATKFELSPVYTKLNYLASTTAPTYSKNGIMRGTIVRMNIGDYLSDTPGFLTSVNYSWESSYPFEIAYGKKDPNAPKSKRGNTDLSVQELPHVLNCSLVFTPIHTFTPQTGKYHYITNPEQGDSQFFPVKQDYAAGTVEVGQGTFGPFGTDGITGATLPLNIGG